MKKWTFDGLYNQKIVDKAVKIISNEIKNSCGYEPSFGTSDRTIKFTLDKNLPEQGYEILVSDTQVIISGGDERGVLYGAVDFIAEYINGVMPASEDIFLENAFENIFDKPFVPWEKKNEPSIRDRAIWTWGYCIYDYQKFFENMAKLKLNMVVIWNDEIPTNAKTVIECAHSWGIKVFFGYAWGWDNKQNQADYLTDSAVKTLIDGCVKKYENYHLPLDLDGIYFQSFTETKEEYMGERTIANVVTELVNATAKVLLDKYPSLKIQFGLHATSVKNHLDDIAKTDDRLGIVWEDMGAFPYDYRPDCIEGYDEMMALQNKACVLRGADDKFGVVYKGMTKLDWTRFVHQDDSAIGVKRDEFIKERTLKRSSLWRFLRSKWLKNFDYFHDSVKNLVKIKGNSVTVQMLVEDGLLESGADLSLKIASQTLFSANETREEIFAKAVLL